MYKDERDILRLRAISFEPSDIMQKREDVHHATIQGRRGHARAVAATSA